MTSLFSEHLLPVTHFLSTCHSTTTCGKVGQASNCKQWLKWGWHHGGANRGPQHTLTRGHHSSSEGDTGQLWCFCEQRSTDELVKCDNMNVQLRTFTLDVYEWEGTYWKKKKTKWYCPSCHRLQKVIRSKKGKYLWAFLMKVCQFWMEKSEK